jgi:hypothetical protein
VNFRAKNFLVSILFPFLFILFLRIAHFDGFILYGTVFAGVLVQYFLGFWLLNFDVYPNGFITILLLPAAWFGAFLLIYQNFIVDLHLVYQIPIILGFLVLQYYFMSTQNILNISHFKSISLSQAAYTTNNFYTILTFFTTNLALFLLPSLSIPLKFILSFIVSSGVLFIFTMLNKISKIEFFFSVFFYLNFTLLLLFLYVLGFIDPGKVVLIVIAMSLVFRGVIILMLYSAKRVIALADYVQIAIESGILFMLIGVASK